MRETDLDGESEEKELEEGEKSRKQVPRLEVFLPDAVPKAFEMVLSYIYTDRIYPARDGK